MDGTALDHALTRGGGVLCRSDVPGQATSLDWLVRTGRLVQVLPGAYAPPATAAEPDVRMRAACRRYPDAVLLGAAAARQTFWPTAPLSEVEVALPVGCDRAPATAGVDGGCPSTWWWSGAGCASAPRR